MSAPIWTRKEIESPCVSVCVVHPDSKLCVGCYRTMDEIRDWSKLSVEQRRTIMDELPQRENKVKPKRRGGRASKLGEK